MAETQTGRKKRTPDEKLAHDQLMLDLRGKALVAKHKAHDARELMHTALAGGSRDGIAAAIDAWKSAVLAKFDADAALEAARNEE